MCDECCILELMLWSRRGKVWYCIQQWHFRSFETIINENLLFEKVYAQYAKWVQKMLIFDQKVHHVAVFSKHLQWFELLESVLLEQMVIHEVMWMHYFTEEWSQPSMEWCHKGFLSPQKFKTQLSAGKIVASVFWYFERAIHVDFLPYDATINAQ
jgi:hypothetical protein